MKRIKLNDSFDNMRRAQKFFAGLAFGGELGL
jgi:hypothetical protein